MPLQSIPSEIRDEWEKINEELKYSQPDLNDEDRAKLTWHIIKQKYKKDKDGKWVRSNAEATMKLNLPLLTAYIAATAGNANGSAISYKNLGIVENKKTEWDGPDEVAKADIDDLKLICGWVDPEKADTKQGYKLPHHKADSHKAVWHGVANAMARLSNTAIPDGDKKAVYNHLKKHYKEFEETAPDFDKLGEIGQTDNDVFSLLDSIFEEREEAKHSSQASSETKITFISDKIAIADAGSLDEDTDTWLADERKRLELPEEHKNALYLHCVMVHADKVMQNATHDILPKEEMEKALSSLLFQPVDVAFDVDWWSGIVTSESFTRHERERISGINGVRGVIYAARANGDSLECGIIVWARDFPMLSEMLVELQEYLGASYDLVANTVTIDKDGNRILKDMCFFGCSLLFKYRAADSATNISDLRYMNEKLEKVVDAAANAGVPLLLIPSLRGMGNDKPDKGVLVVAGQATSSDGNIIALASNEEGDKNMEEIDALKEKVTTLEAQITSQAEVLKSKDEEIESLTEKNTEIATDIERITTEAAASKEHADTAEASLQAFKLADQRMGELLEIGEFESDETKAAMAEKVGGMSDDEYTIAKLQHENSVLKRATASKTSSDSDHPATAAAAPKVGTLSAANDGLASLLPTDPRELGKAAGKRERVAA